MDRIYNASRNEVIEAALDLMQKFDRLHLKFGFSPIDATSTQVVIVIPDVEMSEEKKQQLYARIFDELERSLLFRGEGTTGNRNPRVAN